jgi:hypothetical protein
MSYESGAFGGANNPEYKDAQQTAGTTNNQYGIRDTQDGIVGGGKLESQGSVVEAVVYARGSDFTSGAFDTQLTIPAGSKFVSAIAEVTEAFVLGGTTPTINVGTSGSADTDYGIELSEANGETVGTYFAEGTNGTWSQTAVLANDTVVAVELDGTTPTVTDAGAMKVVIRYIKV